MAINEKTLPVKETEPGKSLGAMVPDNVYWAFKNAASKRKETMQEAMIHAAYLYIDADKKED